ncbi:nucleoside deaminase [uncultured Croceitalea sp.]|uniref:nucleoside deaminase n=1 Tax=uncultured Croceitalea sp. TaxID=1798908 RepID=UPI00330648DE
MRQLLTITFFIAFLSCNENSKPNENMENEEKYVRMAIEVAKESKLNGNLPFGCVLVNSEGEVILKGENTINTDKDCLAHAEINLIRDACIKYGYEFLRDCSVYTSDEPCPMCTSAIYWSGVGKLVYGLSKTRYYEIVGRDNPNWVFEMPTRELLDKGGRHIEVIGPLLEEEASILHID